MTSGFASRRITRDSLADELVGAIVAWRLPPARRLSEEWLARELGVSRTPVREALLRLESQRLAVRSPSGQLVVAPVSEHNVSDVFSVRIALEATAAREAAERVTDRELDDIAELLLRLAMALEAGQLRTFATYGRQFHAAVHAASRNDIAISYLATLQPHVDRYRYLTTLTEVRRPPEAEQGHRSLFLALQARDGAAAADAMTEHLAKGRKATLSAVSRALADPERFEIDLAAIGDGDTWRSPST